MMLLEWRYIKKLLLSLHSHADWMIRLKFNFDFFGEKCNITIKLTDSCCNKRSYFSNNSYRQHSYCRSKCSLLSRHC